MVDEQSRRSVALAEGRRGVTTQLDLFARTVVVELEVARSSDVVVCDRSLVDILAYTDLLPPDTDAADPSDAAMRRAMDAFAEHYLATYAAIFLPSWRLEAVDDDPLRAPVRHRQDELAAHIERRLAPYADRVVRLPDQAAAVDAVVAGSSTTWNHVRGLSAPHGCRRDGVPVHAPAVPPAVRRQHRA